MTSQRSIRILTGAAVVVLAMAGCAAPASEPATPGGEISTTIRVAGATSNPLEQASIEFVRDEIAADYGIAIDYVHIEETRAILEATEKKEVDANVAMHAVYMRAQNEQNGFHLAAVAPLFKQRQVLYSKKYSSPEQLPDGATIAISNSTVAESTALKFLEQLGLVKVDPAVPLSSLGVNNVIENPHDYQFVKVESVPRALDDTDAATATAYSFYVADISSDHEIGFFEGFDDYALQLVVHQDNVEDPNIQKLIAAFKDSRLTQFVTSNYGELVTPLGD